jgi:hypothetical protein
MKQEEKEEVVEVEKKTAKRQHINQLSLIVNTGGYYRGNDEVEITS